MHKIKVNQREIELLFLSYSTMQVKINFVISDDGESIIINGDEENKLDVMFNCILDTFLKIGLQPNDEPNNIGIELENLNVRINHELVTKYRY